MAPFPLILPLWFYPHFMVSLSMKLYIHIVKMYPSPLAYSLMGSFLRFLSQSFLLHGFLPHGSFHTSSTLLYSFISSCTKCSGSFNRVAIQWPDPGAILLYSAESLALLHFAEIPNKIFIKHNGEVSCLGWGNAVAIQEEAC